MREAEEMDQEGLDFRRHEAALDALGRINALSGVSRTFAAFLTALPEPDRLLRVLDVATGGGDVPIRLERRLRGRPVEIHGCDRSSTAVRRARRRAAAAASPTRFFRHDVIADRVPRGYDVIICSLFLHHLRGEQAAALLASMAASGARAIAVSDLLRDRVGLLYAWLGTRALTRSRLARADGMRSIRAAFALAELARVVAGAGLAGARLERRWPARALITWTRPAPAPR